MPNFNYKRRAKFCLYVYSLLCIVVGFCLLWLNSLNNWQSDWTAGSRNTINESSIELLQKLDGPVSLQAYFDSDSKTRQQVIRFIDKYKRFKQDISLKFVDNQLSSDQLIDMGFSQQGELKISYAENDAFINRLNEQEMTSALFKVARKEDTWIAVIQGHGERDPLDAGNNGLSKLVSELNKTGIKVQPINLLSQAVIPDNTKVLIIAGARNAYLGGELKLIEEFLENGGNLLWLRDPAKQNYFSSLDESLSLSLIPGVVIDANTKLRILLGIKHAAVIPVTEFHKHSITETLKTHLLFPFASAMRHQTGSDWQAHTLFRSLERSWAEVGEINTDKLKYEQDIGDTQGPLTIGLSLSRKHKEQQQRVIVIGDSDFIANGYIGFGANFELSLNIINWLTEDDKLLSITHRAAPDQSLELGDKDVTFIALILLLLVPGLLVGTGLVIRWRRHKH
ncbi:MAG: GldG family protein [Gammaproteobacteria bacterium]|nr:GldG family protein [Gammaproteobacteria bacterium]